MMFERTRRQQPAKTEDPSQRQSHIGAIDYSDRYERPAGDLVAMLKALMEIGADRAGSAAYEFYQHDAGFGGVSCWEDIPRDEVPTEVPKILAAGGAIAIQSGRMVPHQNTAFLGRKPKNKTYFKPDLDRAAELGHSGWHRFDSIDALHAWLGNSLQNGDRSCGPASTSRLRGSPRALHSA
ncbi:hypothetical protein ACFL6C_10400 [Myxococcota bacterium]